MSEERMTHAEWCAWRDGLKAGLIYGVAIGIVLLIVLNTISIWLD